MDVFTVSFFGHRIIENALEIENRLERLIRTLLREHEGRTVCARGQPMVAPGKETGNTHKTATDVAYK